MVKLGIILPSKATEYSDSQNDSHKCMHDNKLHKREAFVVKSVLGFKLT